MDGNKLGTTIKEGQYNKGALYVEQSNFDSSNTQGTDEESELEGCSN